MLRRSLYGSVAAEVKQFPIVLGLDELTGLRGNVPTLVQTTEKATENMGVGDMKKFIAITTDNPTTMQAYRKAMQKKHPWLLVQISLHRGIAIVLTAFYDSYLLVSFMDSTP